MKKLTMVSVWAKGVRATAFVQAEVHADGKVRVPHNTILDAFKRQHGIDIRARGTAHMIGG